MKGKTCAVLFCLLFTVSSYSQSAPWSLNECIEHAWKNNLDIQSAILNAKNNQIQQNSASMAQLPTLNFSASQFVQSGRSLDRFTNQFTQNSIGSNNFQLQTGFTIFNGFQIQENKKAAGLNANASVHDVESIKQNIALNVASLFLSIIQAKELIKSAEANKNNTITQLERTQKLFDAGMINEGNVLSLKAQLANDEIQIINAKSSELNATVNLKNVLRINAETPFDILMPAINKTNLETAYTISQLYDSAIKRREDYLAASFRVMAAEHRLKAAKGANLPSLSFGGSLSTVRSGNANEYSVTGYSGEKLLGYVKSTNDLVYQPIPTVTSKTIAFNQQVKDNFGQNFGFTLNIPIFNQFNARNNIQSSKIDVQRNKIAMEKVAQNLYSEITNAYNLYATSKLKYNAAKLSVEAQQVNVDFLQKKADAGQANIFEYQLAKNNLQSANTNLISTQYELIFRTLVLDFYAGKKLSF